MITRLKDRKFAHLIFFVALSFFHWREVALRYYGTRPGQKNLELRKRTVSRQTRRGLERTTVGRSRKNLELARNESGSLQVSRHWISRRKGLWQTDKRDLSWNKRRREDVLCTFVIVLESEESPIRNKIHQIWRDANLWKGLRIPSVQICKINKWMQTFFSNWLILR